MKLHLVALPALLGACAAQVTHPTKSVSQMQADIDLCTHSANRKYWMDPIAALYNAQDCLDAMGYKRSRGFAAKVERSAGEDRARRAPAAFTQPCVVPCRPKRKP